MIAIENLKDNIIDLDGLKEYSQDFVVSSFNDNGKIQPFQIELVSTEDIIVETFDISSIRINIDVEFIIKEEYIVLKNLIGEKLIITVKPNEYYVNDRDYKFKITKNEINKNGDLRLKILSKVNNTEIGWKCIYDGKPIKYTITPMENTKSSNVLIKLESLMLSDFTSVFKFQQEESGEIIKYKVNNTPEGMKLIEG